MVLQCKIKSIRWKWVINFEDVTWEANKNSSELISETLLMRNGTGKTSTLLLLQHLFSNSDVPDSLLERIKYTGLLGTKEIDKKGGDSEFSVDIDVKGKIWTLGYKFKDDFSSASLFTQTPSGLVSGYDMPAQFSSAFDNNMELTKLLFFDSQFAGSDGRRMNKETIDGTMKVLGNVKILDEARRGLIPNFIEAQRKKSDKKGSAKEKNLAETALKRCKSTIRDLNKNLEKAKKELQQKESTLSDTKAKILEIKNKSKMNTEFNKIEKELKTARDLVSSTSKDLLELLMSPANLNPKLWSPVREYYSKLSKSRIPSAIAKEWLGSILEEKKCICEDSLCPKKESLIQAKMEKSMGLGILSEVYIMKDKVQVTQQEKDPSVSVLKTRLSEEISQRDKLSSKSARLVVALGGKTQTSLEDLGGIKKELEIKISSLKDKIEMYSTTNDGQIKTNKKDWLKRSITIDGKPAAKPEFIGECQNIYWLEQIQKHLNKKLDAIAGIEDLSAAGDIIAETFQAVEEAVLLSMREAVLEQSSKNLTKFNMQNDLRIHSLNNGVTCIDSGGNTQAGFSTGEELAILFSFISALSKVTELSVPMIVDNPTKGADQSKLDGIEGSLSSFEHQLILLIYATERNNLPNYFSPIHTNPTTFMRENESMDGTDGKLRGMFKTIYDWDTFDNYHPPVPKKPTMKGGN
jgi:hypothetical protein